jgi:hypothetical protein
MQVGEERRCCWSGKCEGHAGVWGRNNVEIKFPGRRKVVSEVSETGDQDFLETGSCL